MKNIIIRVLILTMFFSILPSIPSFSGTTYAAAVEEHQDSTQMDPSSDHQRKKLSDELLIPESDIQDILDQGYTLEDVEKALQRQKERGGNLSDRLDEVKPRPVNNSKSAKSTITSSLGEQTFSMSVAASTTSSPAPDYSYVKTKPDEAPFAIQLDSETVSTLSGGLSIQADDLSLPGRNGLGFTLTRTYDSNASQFEQMTIAQGSNGTQQPLEEKRFPIGKGWSWDISFLEINETGKFLHLAGSGVFKIGDNNTLVGYPWKDLSFTADTTVTVNGVTSAYVLKSIQNVSQYFNAQGQLIQISGAYNNKVTFNYANDARYGSVLSQITDPVGNSINISYTLDSVVITSSNKKVTYYKKTQNGKELLGQVVDSVGRAVTYDYSLQNAQFNLLGTTPNTGNPYALLTGVTYTTGAKSVYTFESSPVTRYIGTNAVNQVYRVKSREDRIFKSDGSIEVVNHKDISYPSSDIGSSYNTDFTFSVMVNDGTKETTFSNDKDYIDDNNPPVFYNTKISDKAIYNGITYTKTTDYTYDRARRWPVPVTTKTTDASSGTTSTYVRTSSNSYDDYGNVTASTDAAGAITSYIFNSTSHLLATVAKQINGSQLWQYTQLTRNTQGTVIKEQVFAGNSAGQTGNPLRETSYENIDPSTGNIGQIRVKNGTVNDTLTAIEYSSVYNSAFPTKTTTAIRDINGNASTITKQYQYNMADGNLTQFTDGYPSTTRYAYDALGRITKVTHPDGSFSSISYNDYLNRITLADETGVKTVTNWNPVGWKVDSGFLEGGVYKAKTKNGYDSKGRLLWTEDAFGNRTNYGYDQWSRQTSIQYPNGGLNATVVYDDISNSMSSTDPEGYVLKEYYDTLGRTVKKEETKKSGQPSTLMMYTYDNAGNMIKATDNVNPSNTTTYSYDALSQLKSVSNVVDGVTQTTSYGYNMLGNLTQITYPDNKATTKQYDELGRLIRNSVIAVSGKNNIESYYYDGNDNQTKLIDRNGSRFKYTYDNRNQLKKKEIVDTSWNPISGEETISFGYDLAGRRTSMSDGTGNTSYAYNSSTGDLKAVTFPDGKKITYDYDANGNRNVMNDPFGFNTYYHYDSRNRLDAVGPSIDFATDFDAKYQYFNDNLLKQITQRNGVTTSYTYDGKNIGTLVEKKSDGSLLNSFSYSYDNNGNLKTRTENGTTNSFIYDELNRIKTSSQFNETYRYDSRGNRTSLSTNRPFDRPDETTTFNKRDQLTSVKPASSGRVTYRYNGDGLLWERSENGQSVRYYWDGDQIIAEANVAKQKVDNTSASIVYSGAWTLSTDSSDYGGSSTYSSVATNSAEFTFTGSSVDVAMRKGAYSGKVDVVLDGTVVATDIDLYSSSYRFQQFVYTSGTLSFGKHTIKIVVKGTKNASSLNTNVVLDYIQYDNGGSSTMKARYIRGNSLVAREDSQGKAYYVQNGHGDITNLMDSSGKTVLNQYSYDIFGNISSQSESIPQMFKYSGEMQDGAVGLQYLRARWYDPSIGRFIGEDTYEGQIRNPLSLNMYTYVSNNPLIYSDPTGNWCSATVNGKYYSHPGDCNGSGNGQVHIKDSISINFGRTIYEGGVAKGKWYPKGSFHITGDKSGISDAFIGCFYDTQCSGFVGGAISSGPSVVKSGINKTSNWVKSFIGAGNASKTYANLAKQATKNIKSSEVVLGKYNQGGVSYVKVAQERGATYFELDNWDEVVSKVGENNIWNINKSFIKQQAKAGKSFILSHNPAEATGYFANEVNLLREMGYSFVRDGSIWKSIK
ncbi:RHS repeat-associated core domain-containing protein [Paenibacillus beijingensis]|uniref:RHS repeat-associated core domain-containing protein n=1 Tax=Paenibacillus beijingensis TaxID=1126833 RepID=UPI000695DB41|nr:RHS repeat-associated core domain-containing protein [Paenibacillus beijingensis]